MIERSKEKLVQVITSSVLDEKIIETLEAVGVKGYTVFDVRGDGETGLQDCHLEGESNVLFMVSVDMSIYEPLLQKLSRFIRKGHHLMIMSSDVEVIYPLEEDE